MNPDNPVNPVYIKIESIHHDFEILRKKFRNFSILDRQELWSTPYLNGNFLFLKDLFVFYISGMVYAYFYIKMIYSKNERNTPSTSTHNNN